jgi:hypothetical protein
LARRCSGHLVPSLPEPDQAVDLMDDPQVHYLPLTPGFFSILVFLALALVILIQLRILGYAYMRLGVGPGVALLLLFGSLDYFNLPITVLPGPPVRSGQIVDFLRYALCGAIRGFAQHNWL